MCVLFEVNRDGEVEDRVGVLERERNRIAASELVAVAQHIGLDLGAELADEQQIRVVYNDRLLLVAVA